MSSMSARQRHRGVVAVAAAAGIVLAAAACSSNSASSNGAAGSGGKVTISINCAPTQAQDPTQHKEWVEDVAIFEKANPTITVNSIYNYPCENTTTFTAMLRAGNEPDIYYSYFTDLPQILQAGQAANITKYVNSTAIPHLNDIAAGAMKAVTTGGNTIYGLPTSNYTQGLVYNRALFTQAGLNPNDPPTTWAQVETDAKAISKLGNGIEGWGDYSASGNGGWHFASYMDALGGTTVNNSGASPTADFNNADGMGILQGLHTLRFTDNA